MKPINPYYFLIASAVIFSLGAVFGWRLRLVVAKWKFERYMTQMVLRGTECKSASQIRHDRP